jgi:hypothetical protein
MKTVSVCVYCGASQSALPEHLTLAERFGAACAARGLRLVYGGGQVGLMGRAARAAHAGGGAVLGVMPRFLERQEIVYEAVPHVMVDTMHERKWIMFQESDAFVVLPGGIGTLEEAVEMLSWKRLGLHDKPMAFLAEDGFWDPFLALLRHTIKARLSPPEIEQGLSFPTSLEACFESLALALALPPAGLAASA